MAMVTETGSHCASGCEDGTRAKACVPEARGGMDGSPWGLWRGLRVSPGVSATGAWRRPRRNRSPRLGGSLLGGTRKGGTASPPPAPPPARPCLWLNPNWNPEGSASGDREGRG